MQPIRELGAVSRATFEREIMVASEPVVFRGLVADWPLVQASRQSVDALCDYLLRFDCGASVNTIYGPPSIKGRFFYNRDLTGFNYRNETARISDGIHYLRNIGDSETPPSLAMQSIPVPANLPGMQHENLCPLLAPDAEPRAWIGTASNVAAHHDGSENIACVVAGRRRFTLFPPEQVANLYIGPLELTPAGAPISMVWLEEPDFDRFPKFREALASAQYAELEPGDAIYVPYLWWHAVRAFDSFNMLVNYWFSPPGVGRPPQMAMVLAMLAMKDLPERYRAIWRTLFEHYVFEANGEPGAHLPPSRRGVLGDLSPSEVKTLRAQLAKAFL